MGQGHEEFWGPAICQDSRCSTGKVVPNRSPFEWRRWAQNRRGTVHLSFRAFPCIKGLLLEQCEGPLLCRFRSAEVQCSGLKGRVATALQFTITTSAGNCISWCSSMLMATGPSVLSVWCSYPLTNHCWWAYICAVHFLGTPHTYLIHRIQNCHMFRILIHFILCYALLCSQIVDACLQQTVANTYYILNKWSHL